MKEHQKNLETDLAFSRQKTELGNRLKSRIQQYGPMTFRNFMFTALYDPEHGFYTKGPAIGIHKGAFNTNAMFPAFAFAIARAIERSEAVLGLPLRILEFGGGTGEFASNLMAFLSTIHDYIIVDISEGLRRQQKAKDIRSVKSLDGLSSIPTFAFGNEVLDALPVHRVMGEGTGQLLELYVSLDEREEFTEMPDHPSTPLLGERLRSEGVTLGRGQVAEICLDFEDFLKGIGEVISKGYLVFIDYGDEASTLYSFTQRNGTLRSFQAQHRVFDPFDCIGDQDLTADVDFTALKMAARKAGFLPVHHSRQGTWLQDLGIEKYVNLATHTEAARNEIFQLTHPARLGSTFDVVIFKRGE